MPRKLIVLLVLLAISACSQIQSLPEASRDEENFHTWWQPLPPSSLGKQAHLDQLISGQFGKKEFHLQAVIVVDEQHFTLVALSAFGHRVLTITYQGVDSERNKNAYRIESSPFIPNDWDSRYLLADLQLALWPLPPLQQALQQSAFRLSESKDQLSRQLWQNEQLILDIRYDSPQHWEKKLQLTNHQRRYQLDINTLLNLNKQPISSDISDKP